MFARVSGIIKCAYGGASSFARVFTTFWCSVVFACQSQLACAVCLFELNARV